MDDLSRLIETHGKAVYGLCRKLTGSTYDADDLYQQTFIISMQKQIDFSRNPKALLMKICVNTWKSQLQKRARRQTLAPQEPLEEESFEILSEEETETLAIRREDVRMVRKILCELEDRYRLPILLLYHSGLSTKEVSLALSLPEGTIKSRIYRAKGIIKKRLKEAGYEAY